MKAWSTTYHGLPPMAIHFEPLPGSRAGAERSSTRGVKERSRSTSFVLACAVRFGLIMSGCRSNIVGEEHQEPTVSKTATVAIRCDSFRDPNEGMPYIPFGITALHTVELGIIRGRHHTALDATRREGEDFDSALKNAFEVAVSKPPPRY